MSPEFTLKHNPTPAISQRFPISEASLGNQPPVAGRSSLGRSMTNSGVSGRYHRERKIMITQWKGVSWCIIFSPKPTALEDACVMTVKIPTQQKPLADKRA